MRRYTIAPGVTRLSADQPRRAAKRVTHWLTVAAVLVKRKPKPVAVAQQALF